MGFIIVAAICAVAAYRLYDDLCDDHAGLAWLAGVLVVVALLAGRGVHAIYRREQAPTMRNIDEVMNRVWPLFFVVALVGGCVSIVL
jgi:hypothetical protein